MKYIKDLNEGSKVQGIYLVKEKRSAETRNGKPYENLILQDKTGTVDGKIWDPNSPGIYDFDAMDFVELTADVTSFNNNLQLNVRSARRAEEGEYNPADYMPSSAKSVEGMYEELLGYVKQVQNHYLHDLLTSFFVDDETFIKTFKEHSAAKSIHHSFSGGLLEHTLSVVRMCEYMAGAYPMINRDMLYTAAICHDIGKTQELSDFPMNDYTDEGQLLGHIVIGVEMLSDHIRSIEGFPVKLANQLKHCILGHHGEYEYGSPKLPSTIEAVALNLADNCDAKMQILTELFAEKGAKADKDGWIGYNRLFETNLRKTEVQG